MAIDPDVQVITDDHAARLTALEEGGPPPGNVDLPYELFGPNVTAQVINDTARDMWRNYNGGHIVIDGHNLPIKTTEPIVLQPGVHLEGVGQPMLYHDTRTRIQPQFSGPVFHLDDGKPDKREAWGASRLEKFQIEVTRPGVTGIYQTGGNGSHVSDIHQTGATLEYGILLADGRPGKGDGQYSDWVRCRFTRAKHGLTVEKRVPDSRFRECMFYGNHSSDSTGVVVNDQNNNLEFTSCDVQFVSQGWYINSREIEVTGGSWENRPTSDKWADYAIRLGPGARDVTFRSYSIANLGSLKTVFVFDEGAHRFTFDLLSGHVDPSDVPAGYGPHFRWHS